MRLLHLNDDGNFHVTKDLVPNPHPYAILSHTWGDDDQEVTFQDIQHHAGQHKAGYRKLEFCGKQAAADGLRYFWVDTCCIDKSNNTELSEAINSMFRWYQNATECYVYLSDVSRNDTEDEGPPRAAWKSAFRKSRWFTRGWTLQELIAPRSVSFFTAESQRLGDKVSHEQTLHEITGIPAEALRGKPLSDFSISDRFSWQKNRQTGRDEDLAYSLFGIFDMHLPLIYGEGKRKAFNRLRQEIGRDAVSETGKRCIADLHVTDPRHDKTRIQETKGGLLADSCVWVLNNSHFRQWCDDEDQRLLWVKGNPGKGKTMLLCGIIDQLETELIQRRRLAYFFCQGTDERIRTATAVLRGLIYMLLDQDASLVSYVEKKYETAGKALFEDANAWQALCEIFMDILQDPRPQGVCLIVDALDECVEGLPQLLKLIIRTSEISGVKWLVSSRNWREIKEQLCQVAQRLSLEVNEKSVAAAVDIYITHKVSQLVKQKGYRDKTANEVHQYLSSNADGTFLWVALVCQEIEKSRRGNALQKAKSFPSGLDALYERMMQQIRASEDVELCTQVLALVTTTYRPPSLAESTILIEESYDIADDPESLKEIISLCGSFLTVRKDIVYFVHQSAKDFLMTKQSTVLFPETQASVHNQIFSKSLEAMSQTLKRDMYRLQHPGFSIEDASRQVPDPDPLAAIRYACVHWVNHLVEASKTPARGDSVHDDGAIETFLRSKGLYWIEALSLLRSMSEGMLALEKLRRHLQERSRASGLQALVQDAYRLLQTFRPAIESRPLQTYASALVLSPTKSRMRGLFQHERLRWFECKTELAEDWSACEQTLEGHTSTVNSAAFSGDGQRVVSASDDRTVKVWNRQTGACEQTLAGHTSLVNSAAFSADGQRVVSASGDKTVKVWNAQTSACEQTLAGHTSLVSSAAFSADGQRVVSASHDKTVKVWNAQTGACEQTLAGHTSFVLSAAFSGDGQRVVSVSDDKTVKVWNAQTGACEPTLAGHTHWVYSAAFSADGQRVVSASHDKTVKVWNAQTGACEPTLAGHTGWVLSAAFSADGQRVVSASDDKTVKVWNAQTGACEQTLAGHTSFVSSAAFSADGQRVVSASHDKTVKVWNAQTGACLYTHKVGYTSTVSFDPTGTLIHTDAGDIQVDESMSFNADTHRQQPAQQKDFGLSPDNAWVLLQSKKILWLPPEYRPTRSAVSATERGTNLVLGCPSGRVYIFHLSRS